MVFGYRFLVRFALLLELKATQPKTKNQTKKTTRQPFCLMGRNKFSQHEINIISMLLRRKNAGTRFQQKQIRHQLRVNFEFSISDFNEQGKAFGEDDLQAAIQRKAIVILDDATIADMKAKRQRDRERDQAANLQK